MIAAAQLVGLLLLAAMTVPLLYLIPILLPDLRQYLRLSREWTDLNATVEAARADFDGVRAAEREMLIEDVAREELAGFFAEWDREVAG